MKFTYIMCWSIFSIRYQNLKNCTEFWKRWLVVHTRTSFSSLAGFTDITPHDNLIPFIWHLRENTLSIYYTKVCFKILKKEITFFGLYPNDGFTLNIFIRTLAPCLRPIVRLINYCIRLSPIVFERFWAYWVGGAGEIVITLKTTVMNARLLKIIILRFPLYYSLLLVFNLSSREPHSSSKILSTSKLLEPTESLSFMLGLTKLVKEHIIRWSFIPIYALLAAFEKPFWH